MIVSQKVYSDPRLGKAFLVFSVLRRSSAFAFLGSSPLVCAPGFFRFAVHGGKVILLLNHENYNHYGFHDGYDG